MAPTVTLDTPQDGDTVSLPIVAQATVVPPGAIFALWDDTTGMFLGAVQSDGTGHAQLVVNSLLAPGPRWHQSESASAGSGVTISVGVALESFTGLSVALSAAQAGISAGLKGAALSRSVASAVATWKAGVGVSAATGAVAQSAVTITTTAALVQAQIDVLGQSATAAMVAVQAGMSAAGFGASVSSATVALTMAASAGITTVGTATYQSRNTTGSLTVTLPSGVTTNDIIVVACADSTQDANALSGYTRKDTGIAFGCIFYKRAGSSESNPSFASVTGAAICAVFRGCVTTGDPFEATQTTAQGSSATQALTGVTTLTNGAAVLTLALGIDGGWFDGEADGSNTAVDLGTPTGFATTALIDGSYGPLALSLYGFGASYAIKATAGATGTTTWTLNVTEAWPGYSVGQGVGGWTGALKPA